MIAVATLARRKKGKLADATATNLGIAAPYESAGSTIDSLFLNAVHERLFGAPTGGTDTYRMTELLLGRLGLTYDPRWDTSESRGGTGGGTVTARAFSRILVAVTNQARCFLVPASRDGHPMPVRGDKVPQNNAFVDAGPGTSALLFHGRGRTINAVGTAAVKNIEPGWRGPWSTDFWQVELFESPVSINVDMSVGDRPVEITPDSFQTVVMAADGSRLANEDLPETDDPEPWSAAAAEFIDRRYPTDEIDLAPLRSPIDTGAGIEPVAESVPEYSENYENGQVQVGAKDPAPRVTSRLAAKIAEDRAVALTTRALELDGWRLVRDRQKDGVGYDLLFGRAKDEIHVEVKGIQGPDLAFNLTPKEWWRAQTDPDWFVVAVTSVLSPTKPALHAVSRGQVLAARRMSAGYRLWPD